MYAQQVAMPGAPMPAVQSFLPPVMGAVGTATYGSVGAPAVATVTSKPASAAEAYAAYTASQNSYIPAPTAMTAPTVVAATPQAQYVTAAPAVEYVQAPAVVETVAPAPVVSYAQPAISSFIPAPVPAVETIVQAPSYLPAPVGMAAPPMPITTAPAPQVVSYMPPAQVAPVVVEQFAPAMGMDGQSVVVEQIGDWLVCEDALGLFWHHAPTQQSFDNAPPEFLMLFPQGYAAPPLGAFAQSGMMAAPMPGAPLVVEQFAPAPVTYASPTVGSYLPPAYAAPAPVVYEQFTTAPTTYSTVAPVVASTPVVAQPVGGVPTQLPPMMAKVLN